MKTEYEVKILDSNYDDIKKKLNTLGAKCLQPRRMMRRLIVDYPDNSLQLDNCYIRIRDEGNRITTTYKQTTSRTIEGVQELEVEVSNLETMMSIYEKLGLVAQSYQETYRESWELEDGTQIEFDEWPWLEPFIEIEAESEAKVRELVEKLGYDWVDVKFGDVVQLYQDIFDIDDWKIARAKEIKFGPIPQWLEERRK